MESEILQILASVKQKSPQLYQELRKKKLAV